MAKLFQPIRFWIARFICRKSSASSGSSCPSRPSPGLQPATRRWRVFVCRPSGRPASTKRTSATAALRSPVPNARRPRSRLGIPARLRRSGGRRRFALAASRYLRRTSLLLRTACVRSSSPGFTHAQRDAAGFLPPPRQPAAARVRSRLSLSASGSAVSNQAGLLQTKITAMSIGVNRPGCVPCQAGSRLVFCRQSKLS